MAECGCQKKLHSDDGLWWCKHGPEAGFVQLDYSKPYRSHDWNDPGTSAPSVCRACGARSYGTAAYLTCTGEPL